MTTARDIVTRSLRKIGVVAVDTPADANEMQEGLDALNMMLSAWQLQGIDRAHTALEASDSFPLDAKFEEGTVYLLASRLSPDYMVPQSFDADTWFRQIQAAYVVIPTVAMPKALQKMPSQYWPAPSLRGYQGTSN